MGGGDRCKVGHRRKIVRRESDVSLFCQFKDMLWRLQANGQDDKIKVFFNLLPLFIDVVQPQVAFTAFRLNAIDPAADKPDPGFIFGPLVVFVKFFAVGSHVHVKDGGLQAGGMVLGNNRFLDGIHTADR